MDFISCCRTRSAALVNKVSYLFPRIVAAIHAYCQAWVMWRLLTLINFVSANIEKDILNCDCELETGRSWIEVRMRQAQLLGEFIRRFKSQKYFSLEHFSLSISFDIEPHLSCNSTLSKCSIETQKLFLFQVRAARRNCFTGKYKRRSRIECLPFSRNKGKRKLSHKRKSY